MKRSNLRRSGGIRISRSIITLVILFLIVHTSLTYYFLDRNSKEVDTAISNQNAAIKDAEDLQKKVETLQKENERLKERLKILDVIEKFAPEMSPEEKTKASGVIQEQSEKYGFQPLVLLALIMTESTFDTDAVSKRGARGMMQVMPSLQKEWKDKLEPDEESILDLDLGDRNLLKDPEGNIRLGTAYLISLIIRFGDVETAIKAYNHGPTEVSRRLRGGKRIPAVYYQKVKENYEMLARTFGELEAGDRGDNAVDQRSHREDGKG